MKFNQLKTVIETLMAADFRICLFVISCNDEKSANNSTPGAMKAMLIQLLPLRLLHRQIRQKIRKSIMAKACR